MSRRLRLEAERLKAFKQEEEEEEDHFTQQLRRIYSPIVWRRTATGFRIEDLKEKYFDEVIQMIKDYYLDNDVLCKNTELFNDEVSLASYLERVLFYMKDLCSLVAVDENYVEEGEEGAKKKKTKKGQEKIKIVGVLILRVVDKKDYGRVFSRVQLIEGDAMKKCIALRSHLARKVDVYAKFNCDSFLRYYDICIAPEYRSKGLGFLLMYSGLDVARAMNVPVVMGMFSTFSLQRVAKRLGMETLYEVSYVDWRDADNEMVFDDPGAGNYTCALMAGVVPPAPVPAAIAAARQAAIKGETRTDKKAEAAKRK